MILAKASYRWRVNRSASKWLKLLIIGKRKTGSAQREATPRKRKRSMIALAFFAAIFMMNYVNIWSQLIPRLADALDRETIEARGKVPIGERAFRAVVEVVEASRNDPSQDPSVYRTSLRRAFSKERSYSAFNLEDGAHSVDDMIAILEDRGLSGFEVVKDRGFPGMWPRSIFWPEEENSGAMVLYLGTILTVLSIGALLADLGIRNMDLGKVDWDLSWLFSLPISARDLFSSKIIEYSIFNFFCWAFIMPYLFVSFWSSGYGWWGAPLALISTAYLSVLVASLRLVVETWSKKRFSRKATRNFQSVFTILGVFCLLVSFAGAMPGQTHRLLAVLSRLPHFLAWSPFSLPIFFCERAWSMVLPAAGAIVSLVVFFKVSPSAAGYLVRDGLIREPGPYLGRRGRAQSGGSRQVDLKGIIGKDIRLLLRNRALMTQMTIVPFLVVFFNLAFKPIMSEATASDLRHSATMAFGSGLFVLLFAAGMIMAIEADSLWLLFSFPRKLSRAITEKTHLWAGIASIYGALVLIFSLARTDAVDWTELWAPLYALVGIVIYAYMASGLAVITMDPYEREVQYRQRPEMSLLLVFFGSMFCFGIYAPSIHAQLVVLGLSALLAYSIWQNAMRQLPYILDPTYSPPHRIGLGDGALAVYVFFVLQGLISLPFLLRRQAPSAELLVFTYTASAIAITLVSLFIFQRLKIPNLYETIGLRRCESAPAKRVAFRIGAFWGLLAGVFGVAYLYLIDLFEPLRELKEQTLDMVGTTKGSGIACIAFWMVIVVPPFEEYIFRGLVFKGMRSSSRPLIAILGSAAIFAMVHPPISVLPVFVLGIAAAISFERSGLLIAPIVAHATYNAVVLAAQLAGAA